MSTKLNRLSFNTYKWREENGYTTPEWEMYVENRSVVGMVGCIFFGMISAIVGMVIGPAYIQELQYIPYVPSESAIADIGFMVWDLVAGIFELLSTAALFYLLVVGMIGFWNRLGTDNDIVLKKCMLHKALWWHRALMAKAKAKVE